MANPFSRVEQSGHFRFYVFGSALSSLAAANDLDLLVIYNDQETRAESVYDVLADVFSHISVIVGLPVHPSVLTEREATAENFTERFKCLPLEEWAIANNLALPGD
jgi:predicted nucleotidyltransferase